MTTKEAENIEREIIQEISQLPTRDQQALLMGIQRGIITLADLAAKIRVRLREET
jgi:hypothetical protein